MKSVFWRSGYALIAALASSLVFTFTVPAQDKGSGTVVSKQDSDKKQTAIVQEEYENKAKQLVRFPKYTKWPANFGNINEKEFVIGVLGDDPFGKYLTQFDGTELAKTGQKFVIKRFATVDEFEPCHMLFICRDSAPNTPPQTAEERLKAVIEKAKDNRPLIVSDTKGLNQKGSMINFFFLEESGKTKVKFEINQQALKEAKIEIEAQVLALAKEPKA